jgi:succinate dehydrogenase/fumarate reductase flavoprotein subunit
MTAPDAEIGDPAVANPDAFDHVRDMGKGPIWMDPRGISAEDEQYMRWGFESEGLSHLLRWIDREGIDIKKTRFEFTVLQPQIQIETRVDTNFKTNVDGLYTVLRWTLNRSAAGGMVAGEAAAKDSKKAVTVDLKKFKDKILAAKQGYEEMLVRNGPQFADWREVQAAIWQIMHCYALPPKRTEQTLLAGYRHLLRLKEEAPKLLKAENVHDLYHCLEVLNLLDVAELAILAVVERKESRGQAKRLDYPFTNPMLNKYLVIRRENGRPTFRWEKIR